jgi:hypothetical protein
MATKKKEDTVPFEWHEAQMNLGHENYVALAETVTKQQKTCYDLRLENQNLKEVIIDLLLNRKVK